ncbi:MAG: zinc-dependent metalloprotease [Calditrichaceae bacterium]|nr:zinc-dependent metalloprotease [Calditrichia bacterium]NUQ42135.1 zinc-dependent metalloprotease [Calditrichaceae bacterium]
MRRQNYLFLLIAVLALGALPRLSAQVPEVTLAAEDSAKKAESKDDAEKKKKPKGKTFAEVIEECEAIEGLFTLYRNEKEGKVYVEITPGQFETVYLCNVTRESGDGSLYDAAAQLQEFPFFFKRVGNNVQFIEKNLRFRADKDAAIARALQRDVSYSLQGSAKILSEPHPERGSVLIDAEELFLQDVGMVGQTSGDSKTSYSFDKSNSYFSMLKSFPQNTEIEATLHFKSSKPQPVFTLADSRSMVHRYHFSLSTLPESDYRPRPADDRVGHFYTMHQDYNSLLRDDPYERYINRWRLQKSEPNLKLSKPRQPIVFWLENTIPPEYREAVRQGVLRWNGAFERIGFKEAIEVRQMPDDADWDPADARYNTIRWIVQPGAAYAVGPSRANPYTGQIYDADIRISADYLRFYFQEFEQFVTPTAWMSADFSLFFPGPELPEARAGSEFPFFCDFARGFAHQFAFGRSLLSARSAGRLDSAELQKYVYDATLSLVAHEVGHTLGLRHNFKASAIHNLAQLHDSEFTQKNGLTGSLMDYHPVNLSAAGQKQGDYFQTTLGPYDYWAIEYAYTPYDPDSKISEKEMLERIARRATEPELRYGTDEDAFGLSPRSIDPTCNLWDMGSDPLGYYRLRLNLAQELWRNLAKEFDIEGERYNKLRQAFNQGLIEYALAGQTAGKYLGGIYNYRDHIGDPGGRPPFEIVKAEKQREALQFLVEKFFSPNSFDFDPDLLNRLATDRYWDFEGTVFRISRLDYPIHGIVQLLQAAALFRLYDPLVLTRIQDNEIRFPRGETPFTMAEMFAGLREAIWREIPAGENIRSFRRELQRIHLYILTEIVVKFPAGVPQDAVTLARADLVKIKAEIERRRASANTDAYTEAHLQESAAKIDAALNARMERR